MKGVAVALCVWLGVLAVACEAEQPIPTRLVLAVTSDVPASEFARIEFSYTGRDGALKRASAQYPDATRAVNLHMVLLHAGGDQLGPITVSARGELKSGEAYTRTHIVSFRRGQTLTVPLHLVRACLQQRRACGEGETCSEAGCVPIRRDNLDPWKGPLPDLDPSTVDGDPGDGRDGSGHDGEPNDGASDGEPSDGAGDGAGDGEPSDGEPGEVDAGMPSIDAGEPVCDPATADLTRDETCGSCTNDCTTMGSSEQLHARYRCVNMECKPRCQQGWGNCNARLVDGCETDLNTDPAHCGRCIVSCESTQQCVSGSCQ